MTLSNPNRVKIYRLSTNNLNRSRLNTMVFIIGLSGLLWACYLTNKGYSECVQSGKYSQTECVKLHLG